MMAREGSCKTNLWQFLLKGQHPEFQMTQEGIQNGKERATKEVCQNQIVLDDSDSGCYHTGTELAGGHRRGTGTKADGCACAWRVFRRIGLGQREYPVAERRLSRDCTGKSAARA